MNLTLKSRIAKIASPNVVELDLKRRAQFGRLAEQLYVPRLRQIQQQVMSQRDLLDQYGPGSFDLVVPPSLRQELGWEPRPQQRHGAPQGQPSARRPRLVGSF